MTNKTIPITATPTSTVPTVTTPTVPTTNIINNHNNNNNAPPNDTKKKNPLANVLLVCKSFLKISIVVLHDENIKPTRNKKEKNYLSKEDEVIPALKAVFERRKEEAALYCHAYHTC